MQTKNEGPWPFDPFTVEGQTELARMGFTPSRSRKPQKHARAVAALDRAEATMRRAFKRWEKLRSLVVRYERELERDHSHE
jgi:hypothetical protein